MALLDWLLPRRARDVRDALAEHRAASERLRRAIGKGRALTAEERLDDLQDAFAELGSPARIGGRDTDGDHR